MDASIIIIVSSITTGLIAFFGLLKNIKHIKSFCCSSDCAEESTETEEERTEKEEILIKSLNDLNKRIENSPILKKKKNYS